MIIIAKNIPGCAYNLTQIPEGLLLGAGVTAEQWPEWSKQAGPKWSGKEPPPAVGARVLVRMNALGHGRVVGYFIEHGWLGVQVENLENRPEWHVRQNGERSYCLVFGNEIEAAP